MDEKFIKDLRNFIFQETDNSNLVKNSIDIGILFKIRFLEREFRVTKLNLLKKGFFSFDIEVINDNKKILQKQLIYDLNMDELTSTIFKIIIDSLPYNKEELCRLLNVEPKKIFFFCLAKKAIQVYEDFNKHKEKILKLNSLIQEVKKEIDNYENELFIFMPKLDNLKLQKFELIKDYYNTIEKAANIKEKAKTDIYNTYHELLKNYYNDKQLIYLINVYFDNLCHL